MKPFESTNSELDKLTVQCILEFIANTNSPISYGELAKRVGIKRGKSISPESFAYALGRIQEYCKELRLPTLSAMVVNSSLKPGDGFLPMYLQLHPEEIGKNKEEIFRNQKALILKCTEWQRLYDYMGIEQDAPHIRNRFEEDKAKLALEEGKRIEAKIRTEVERNSEARMQCLTAKGYRCFICEQSSEEIYGIPGIIHVHHLRPFSECGVGSRPVDPIKDLIPVCPTCHAVIHSKTNPCYTPNEVRRMLDKAPLNDYETLPESAS